MSVENGDQLTDRQRRYVRCVAQGMDSRDAAIVAGYSKSFSAVAKSRLGKLPEVAQAIADVRMEVRKQTCFGLVEAMKEAEDAAAFATELKNPMARVKAVELRAKLSGLLVDKIEVVSVDLNRALELAAQRVFGPINLASVTAPGAPHWIPRIAGDESDAQLAETGNSAQ